MNKSLRTVAIASLSGAMLLAAALEMAGDNPKSAGNEREVAVGAKKETKHRAYLGVAVEPLRSALWSHLRDVLQQRRGLLVIQVAKDSPANKAGIETDDILVTYGDQKLFTPEQLVGLVHADKAGHDVTLGIVRNGEWREIHVALGEQADLLSKAEEFLANQ